MAQTETLAEGCGQQAAFWIEYMACTGSVTEHDGKMLLSGKEFQHGAERVYDSAATLAEAKNRISELRKLADKLEKHYVARICTDVQFRNAKMKYGKVRITFTKEQDVEAVLL